MVGRKHGSIAIIERFIRSFKEEHVGRILVPFRAVDFREAVSWYVDWYNTCRPHQSLDGRTPQDVYSGSTTSTPELRVCGDGAVKSILVVSHLHNQPHLPVVELRPAA
jgi:transposase InsO family protein